MLDIVGSQDNLLRMDSRQDLFLFFLVLFSFFLSLSFMNCVNALPLLGDNLNNFPINQRKPTKNKTINISIIKNAKLVSVLFILYLFFS